MAYEAKPGQFTLFPNDRKTQPNHPDYKGDGKDLNGNPVWVSAWLKQGSRGDFLSCTMQPKEAQQGKPAPRQQAASNYSKAKNGELPAFDDMN